MYRQNLTDDLTWKPFLFALVGKLSKQSKNIKSRVQAAQLFPCAGWPQKNSAQNIEHTHELSRNNFLLRRNLTHPLFITSYKQCFATLQTVSSVTERWFYHNFCPKNNYEYARGIIIIYDFDNTALRSRHWNSLAIRRQWHFQML